jgi:hypothetical protein
MGTFRKQKTEDRRQKIFFRLFSVLCPLFSVLYSLSSVCFAQSISSIELINNAKQYDGKTITYEGEVIGDVMKRGDFAWINLNDGVQAIGVWLQNSLLKDITFTGSYSSKGDMVEVKGVFHRACPEHGGDLDIHAQSIRKISPGRIERENFNLSKRNYAIFLLGILGLVWILTLLKRS